MSRNFNGLDIESTVTVERCWVCDSLSTIHQRFVNSLSTVYQRFTNSLEINCEKQQYAIGINQFS